MQDIFGQEPIFLDFETDAIEGRHTGRYPPKPVGLAVYDRTTGEAKYYVGDDMQRRVKEIWASGRLTCWHNAKFDLDVAEEHLGVPWPEFHHDTHITAFLHDCHAPFLSLKWLAENWCGDPPATRDELHEWILANVPEATPKTAGAYICRAPVELVGPYAVDDVRKTALLYDHTLEAIQKQRDAYIREIKLTKVLVDMERRGVTIDYDKMIADKAVLENNIEKSAQWVRDRLGVPDLELTKSAQLAKALLESDAIDKSKKWPSTKSGKSSTDKFTVANMITDKALADVIRYHGYNQTIYRTFCSAWCEQATREKPTIYCQYAQVRGEAGGTRTGRLSSTPNFQNTPTRYPPLENLPPEFDPLPYVRDWVAAPDGYKLISADFDGQELHVFAHFEDGQLKQKYIEDPEADLHQFAADLMSGLLGRQIPRIRAKALAFTILYGAGKAKVANMLNIPEDEAQLMIDAYKDAVATKLRAIGAEMKRRYKIREPFRTLGGRLVRGEPPRLVDGKLREFSYKMLNLLVQGSSADQTKQAMVNFKGPGHLFLSVHDELIVIAKDEDVEAAKAALVETMINALPLSVPMMAKAKSGRTYRSIK